MGTRPRLEFRVSGEQRNETNNDKGGALSADKVPSQPAQREPAVESEMSPPPDPPEPDPTAFEPPNPDPPEAGFSEAGIENYEEQGRPEAVGGDGTIGSVQEVFAIARDKFGSSNDNGGG
jgi:hypothetical protein